MHYILSNYAKEYGPKGFHGLTKVTELDSGGASWSTWLQSLCSFCQTLMALCGGPEQKVILLLAGFGPRGKRKGSPHSRFMALKSSKLY